jgi:AcrR family transcriptional regulator
MMTHQPATEKRKPRADAVRNRERVLDAAKAVFSQGGPEASLEAVARQAGVGIGTLYRHFPTMEALYETVYRHEVEQLVELARHLEAEAAPVEALRHWLRAGVEFVATKKGMAAALAMAAHSSSDLVVYSLDRLTGAVRELLQRAVATGEIRADIDPRTCSVLWSACATRTTGRVGKPRCCAWSTSSSMDYAVGAIRDTTDRPVRRRVSRSPDVLRPPNQPNLGPAVKVRLGHKER